MIAWLDVPYADKEAAKAAGAWWNPERRRWYVPEQRMDSLMAFHRWLPDGAPQVEQAPERRQQRQTARPGRRRPSSRSHGSTQPNGGFRSLCDCDVLPWVDCPHTIGATV